MSDTKKVGPVTHERAVTMDKFEFVPAFITSEVAEQAANEARALKDTLPGRVLEVRAEQADTDDLKANYSVVRISNGLDDEAELSALPKIAPTIYGVVDALCQHLRLQPATVSVNFYDPYTWIPRHSDRSAGSPQTFVTVGLEGEGEFTVYGYDPETSEEDNRPLQLLEGDAVVLHPVRNSMLRPATTVEHSGANRADAERVVLNVSFISPRNLGTDAPS